MAQANANEYWSENVKEHFHTPSGTFTQDAEEITNILLKVPTATPRWLCAVCCFT